MAVSCYYFLIGMFYRSQPSILCGAGALFSSPVFSHRCVGLGVAFRFDVLLTRYDITVVDRAVSHVGVGMSRSRGCSKQDKPYVVFCDEAIIDFSKAVFGCSFDFSETLFLAVA